MMLKGGAHALVMEMSHQILLSITNDPMPEDVILHSPTDIDRINLHEAKMSERFVQRCKACIKARGEAHETAGCASGDHQDDEKEPS